MRSPAHTLALAATTGLALTITTTASAQEELPITGIVLSSNDGLFDFTVPDIAGAIYEFRVYGAPGGDATVVSPSCSAAGGRASDVTMRAVVGFGEFDLTPLHRLRFINGAVGSSAVSANLFTGSAGGGGGGGSAMLFDTSGSLSNFIPIIVAGGGGGGAAFTDANGACGPQSTGGDAPLDNSAGSDGSTGAGGAGAGGSNGQGGSSGASSNITGGGGGGWLASASGTRGGQFCGAMGGIGGGITGARGGFGFGGGGAGILGGGGGGGYSGGGTGGTGGGGGGGGTFTDTRYQQRDPSVSASSFDSGGFTLRLAGQVHNEREQALPIIFDDRFNSTTIIGTTNQASISPLDGVNDPARDVWYTYTNTKFCELSVEFLFASALADQFVLIVDDGPPAAFTTDQLVTLQPGETVELRIANGGGLFSVDILLDETTADSDGDGIGDCDDECPGDNLADSDADGICDGLDICPGVDDLTLTDEQINSDVDSDGIVDLCDRACEVDISPDGEYTEDDWILFFFVVALTTEQGRIDNFDFDDSGTFDAFDYAAVSNWCE
ncbi:MAG: hypothetical protein AAGI30_11345 [Planctomycetota bacterium]